ncbi:CDP-glycerol glycerophosphotransferase family protein [Mammaliicoccus fleurettii]|uniref:CDP-glycerol glycerophosphotransferase family protein n=1 Tax=Mammaliicoccus fleurettii TaxID=150056 RepID=UPI002DB650F4|nr:CDP-glycerol glycerophosphotransferase family protein [Mammaliicoccus fleurettii]MEB7725171.1 CDP-glycerol glycerophosphotransferase family protein [Mammaliicoccus fleurettii]
MSTLYKLKNILVRRFDCVSVDDKTDKIVIEYKYKNYLVFNKDQFEVRIQNKTVPVAIKKSGSNHLKVEIDKDLLTFESKETFIKVNCFYNGKKLWVRDNTRGSLYLTIDGKLCEVECTKNMYIKNLNEDYTFVNEKVKLKPFINESNFTFETSNNYQFSKILLINGSNKSEIQLKAIGKSNYTIPIEKIEMLAMEEYKAMYLVNEDNAYRAKFDNKYSFNLYHYYIEINRNNFFVYHKILKAENIILKETPDKYGFIINMKSKGNKHIKEYLNVVLMNYENEIIAKYPVKTYEDMITSKIPYDIFIDNRAKKNMYIEAVEEGTSRNVIYSISENVKERIISETAVSINNQYYHMRYISNNGIYVKYRKPFFKNGVNYINENKINFFVKADDIYSHCTFTLTFEERYSKETIEYYIEPGETLLDIKYDEIEKIISKPKTIVDLFITVREQDHIVRKEKIRYRTAKYKKDTYFSKKIIKDNNQEINYLSTITPFKNIKLERFSITNNQLKLMNNKAKDPNIWLIGERFDTAQDNGIVFFNWLRANTSIDAYYVIDENALDYQNLKHNKKVLKFGSIEHFKIASKAKVLVSTHDFENILPYKPAKGFFGYEDTLKVFLQHGVLGRKSVEYHKDYYEQPFDIFNVSSMSEKYDVVVNEMGYDKEQVYISGLSRFDNLPIANENNNIKKILIMPTWRDWLNSDFTFENSEYLEKYLSLIKNKKLNQLIESNNVEINFYPHYRAQSYFKLFLMNNDIKVQYVELGEKSVQSLLIEHDLLITDYSSVSFDFTYMNKPVIFYHFDVERFFRKGILRPIHETFLGEIMYDEKKLVDQIYDYVVKDSFKKVEVEKDSIFKYIDKNNNERIYNSIVENLERQ